MNFPKREIVTQLKASYPPGTRVILRKMDNRQAPPIRTKGIVKHVDDTGTIHVKWDTGGSLGVVYGEDEVEIVK